MFPTKCAPSRELTYPVPKLRLKMIFLFSFGGICDRSLELICVAQCHPLKRKNHRITAGHGPAYIDHEHGMNVVKPRVLVYHITLVGNMEPFTARKTSKHKFDRSLGNSLLKMPEEFSFFNSWIYFSAQSPAKPKLQKEHVCLPSSIFQVILLMQNILLTS